MRTQVNMRLPQTHIDRLEAMRAALGLSQSEMVMSLIDTEWGRRQGRGAKRGPLHILPDERMTALVADMNRYELEELEAAVHVRRLELAAGELRARGIPVLTRLPDSARVFGYLLVLAPNYLSAFSEEERRTIPPNVLADAADARHLLDYLRELPPEEAYRRWHRTVTPLSEEQAAEWWYGSYMDYHSATAALKRVRAKQRELYYGDGAADDASAAALDNEETALADMLRDVAGAKR